MTSQTKMEHSKTFDPKELYDLCYDTKWFDTREESFNRIRQWLNTNKDDSYSLKASITYQDRDYNTPLHLLLRCCPPLDIVQTIIKSSPEVLKMGDDDLLLPIHQACIIGGVGGTSVEVIRSLITAFPDSIKVKDAFGYLPLHCACQYDASLDVLNLLIEAYSEGMDQKCKGGKKPLDIYKLFSYVKKKDDNDMFPLHHACQNGYSDNLIHFLIQAYPECTKIEDSNGRTPLDYYTSLQGRRSCDKIIELLQPVNKKTSNILVVSSPSVLIPSAHNTEVPPVAQIETHPLPERTDKNEVEIRNVEMNDMKAEIKADINEVKEKIIQVQSDLFEAKAEIVNMKTEVLEIKSMIRDINRFLRGRVSG